MYVFSIVITTTLRSYAYQSRDKWTSIRRLMNVHNCYIYNEHLMEVCIECCPVWIYWITTQITIQLMIRNDDGWRHRILENIRTKKCIVRLTAICCIIRRKDNKSVQFVVLQLSCNSIMTNSDVLFLRRKKKILLLYFPSTLMRRKSSFVISVALEMKLDVK